MATDYDTPRDARDGDGGSDDSIEALKGRREDKQSPVVDADPEAAEGLELPGADLSGEELTVQVVPLQHDEFTCATCFLVHHRTRLGATDRDGRPACRDCAA
ncbi:DUF4193 domain-containing protein [Streptomyces sp. NRRL B-24484]|uniref:DUF4193 domain-containing protein n=1 Tax=Streptomyces sp. NRRL B-24484 TaxID=1463833 RepID=UPI0004C1715B|nr:DUF4193 domain-containing protein [Streptomyces sp. NRRL B-24484]